MRGAYPLFVGVVMDRRSNCVGTATRLRRHTLNLNYSGEPILLACQRFFNESSHTWYHDFPEDERLPSPKKKNTTKMSLRSNKSLNPIPLKQLKYISSDVLVLIALQVSLCWKSFSPE